MITAMTPMRCTRHHHWFAVVMATCLALAAPTLHAEDDKRAAQLRDRKSVV